MTRPKRTTRLRLKWINDHGTPRRDLVLEISLGRWRWFFGVWGSRQANR